MKPTDSIQVNVVNANFIPVNSLTEGIIVTTNNAYVVRNATVASKYPNPGLASDFEINFYAEHTIRPGGGILIVYPP